MNLYLSHQSQTFTSYLLQISSNLTIYPLIETILPFTHNSLKFIQIHSLQQTKPN